MNIQPERSAPSSRATMSGQLALVAWALSPAGAAYLKNLPAFQVLLGIFLAGCIASSITNTVKRIGKISLTDLNIWF